MAETIVPDDVPVPSADVPDWVHNELKRLGGPGELSDSTLDLHRHANVLSFAYMPSAGQAALVQTLGFLHSVAQRCAPYACNTWDVERDRRMTHAKIASLIGISETAFEGKGTRQQGTVDVLEDVGILVVDRTDRDRFGRNFGHAFSLRKGSFWEHLTRLKEAGHLSGRFGLLTAIHAAFDPDLGCAPLTQKQAARAVGCSERTARDLLIELRAKHGPVVCIGPNRFSFREKVWGAKAFGGYTGPIFADDNDAKKPGLVRAKARSGDRSTPVAQKPGLGVKARSGMRKSLAILQTDSLSLSTEVHGGPEGALPSRDQKAAAPLTSLDAPRAREHAAADRDREINTAATRLSFDDFQARVAGLIGDRRLDQLSDDEAYALMAETVRGRMPERLIQLNREDGLQRYRRWATEWHRETQYPAQLLFGEAFVRLDREKTVSSWKLVDLKVGDCIERGRREWVERERWAAEMGATVAPNDSDEIAGVAAGEHRLYVEMVKIVKANVASAALANEHNALAWAGPWIVQSGGVEPFLAVLSEAADEIVDRGGVGHNLQWGDLDDYLGRRIGCPRLARAAPHTRWDSMRARDQSRAQIQRKAREFADPAIELTPGRRHAFDRLVDEARDMNDEELVAYAEGRLSNALKRRERALAGG